MDWSNERYVRLYTRDTTTWKVLPWQSRFVLMSLLRKVDRSGVLDVGDEGLEGLAAVLEVPIEILEAGMPALEKRKTVERVATAYVLPKFLEAQEAAQSDAQRQRVSRERRRDEIRAGLRPSERRQVVYFLQAESGGPIKIGESDDLAGRIASLQTSHPEKLVVLATMNGDREVEAQFHRTFAAHRIRGEWFRPDAEILSAIERVQDVTSRDMSRQVTPSLAVPVLPDPEQPSESPARPRAIHIGAQEPVLVPPPAPAIATIPLAPEARARWSKLAGDVWAFAGLKYLELVGEGVDPSARETAWNGLPTTIAGVRMGELRDHGHSLDDAKQIARGAVETAAARARASRSLQYFTPPFFFAEESFAKSAATTPEQVMRPRAGPQSSKPPAERPRMFKPL